MIKINLITVGKLKEQYWRDAVAEYSKRLGAFCKLEVIELGESKLPEEPSEKQKLTALQKEAKDIEPYLNSKGAFNIAMCIEGKQMSSEELSQKLDSCSVSGYSTVNFIIGSSFSLSPKAMHCLGSICR